MLTEHLTSPASSARIRHRISVLLVDDDDQYAAFVRSVFDETSILEVELRHIRCLRDVLRSHQHGRRARQQHR